MTQPAWQPPVPATDDKHENTDSKVDEEAADGSSGGESFDYDGPEPTR